MATTSPRGGASGHLAADVGGRFAADAAIRQMPDVPPKKIFTTDCTCPQCYPSADGLQAG